MKSTRFRKHPADSSEVSVEALSMTIISAPFVVAKSDAMHVRSMFPEFQLITAIVLVILLLRCKYEHDIQWVHSKSEMGESIHARHPWQVAGEPVGNEVNARIFADAPHAFRY